MPNLIAVSQMVEHMYR